MSSYAKGPSQMKSPRLQDITIYLFDFPAYPSQSSQVSWRIRCELYAHPGSACLCPSLSTSPASRPLKCGRFSVWFPGRRRRLFRKVSAPVPDIASWTAGSGRGYLAVFLRLRWVCPWRIDSRREGSRSSLSAFWFLWGIIEIWSLEIPMFKRRVAVSDELNCQLWGAPRAP